MEKLTFSFGVTLLGMVVVFVGLLILIAFISILSRITSAADRKKEQAAAKAVPAEAVPAEEPAAIEPAADEGISPEVIAAITAAIAAVWDGENGFRVRHVRRVNNASAWNRAGREEQTYSRF